MSASNSSIYFEQDSIVFDQNFTSLAFNVTAIQQTYGGLGVAYLLNGKTDSGLWCQVGIQATIYSKFIVDFDIFQVGVQKALFVANDPINGTVYPGDLVLLSMYFQNQSVVMAIHDWHSLTYKRVIRKHYATNDAYYDNYASSIAINKTLCYLQS